MDQGSQSCYITDELVQQLKLTKHKTKLKTFGLGGCAIETVKWHVTLPIKLNDPNHSIIKTDAFVVDRIINELPALPHNIPWTDSTKPLADPLSNKTSQISILLGSNVTPKLIMNGAETKDSKHSIRMNSFRNTIRRK